MNKPDSADKSRLHCHSRMHRHSRKSGNPVSLLFLLATLLLPLAAFAKQVDGLPRENLVPGGVAVIPISKAHTIATPHVTYNKKRVMVVDGNFIWYAIVGIPLDARPGEHEIRIDRIGAKTRTIPFTVKDKQYETQHITIKDKRKVTPLKQDLVRIKKEKKLINTAFQKWSVDPPAETLFTLPVEGKLSSPFGLRRFFNEKPRKPHSGIDIAAPKGTPLKAPASGTVLATGDYFFNGKSVFIDHGQGLVTMFCHMDNIKVEPGQQLKQGDVFGSIGMTGRVTGPHVHWSVSLNDTRVDPNLFFEQGVEKALAKANGEKDQSM